jgi:hypothetical protein
MTHKESMSQAVKLTRLGSLKTKSNEKEYTLRSTTSATFLNNVRSLRKK